MAFGRQDRHAAPDSHRVNNRIRVPEVRVIDEDGTQLGVMPPYQATKLAQEKGLDLVEVSPAARPPVCKIMDYGKFKYDEKKRQTHQKLQKTKGIVLRPKTDDHDIAFKIKHVEEFIKEGNKVQLSVQFRGREIVHPEEGRKRLMEVIEATKEIAKVDQGPNMEGRKMILVLSPLTIHGSSKKPEPRVEVTTPPPTGPITGRSSSTQVETGRNAPKADSTASGK